IGEGEKNSLIGNRKFADKTISCKGRRMNMAGEAQNGTWSQRDSDFSVTFDNDVKGSFQEASGLETETDAAGNVTLRKGTFVGDERFWNWYSQVSMNTSKRATIVVNLLDQTGALKYVWTLNNAWAAKLNGTDVTSEGNEVAVESLEIAFETMVN